MPEEDSKNSRRDPNEIEVLTYVQSVRQRPQMYVGSTDEQGLCELVYLAMLEAVEGVDIKRNVALAGHRASRIEVTLHADNSVTVADNGRGLPVEECKDNAERVPEVQRILTTGYVPAWNGAATVNALSQQFDVTIWRDGHVWEQSYRQGEPISGLRRTGDSEKHGTSMHFRPDQSIFSASKYDADLLTQTLNKFLSKYKDVVVTLTDERERQSRSK